MGKGRKGTESWERARHAVIYQMFLRAFTPQGTLRAAAELLDRVADLGVDIVYLCPVVCHDPDENRAFWSHRQIESGCENAKNPYRMRDYFHVDPEYGTDEDLRFFVNRAHGLGLLVMLDLVYFHCGPTAVFLGEHPDFVMRDENGGFLNGKWRFPRLNFENPALRAYLRENMLYFVREYGVDGYRCDVGDDVPLDFWEEARRDLDTVKPGLIMLNEGKNPDALGRAFDINYGFDWFGALKQVLTGEAPASLLNETWRRNAEEMPSGGLVTRHMDNHDIANDGYESRLERILGSRALDAALIMNLTLDGVPMLYNGNEIADSARHSIFANREHGRGLTIDWSQAFTRAGRRRFQLTQRLIALRHQLPALTEGKTQLIGTDAPDRVFAFLRETDTQAVLTVVNLSDSAVSCELKCALDGMAAEELLASGARIETKSGAARLEALPWGAAVVRLK